MQRGMGSLDGTQIGLVTVLARAGADELGVAEDAVDRALADRQLEHIHQATRTQAGAIRRAAMTARVTISPVLRG